MRLQENLPELPKQTGFFAKIRQGVSSIRETVSSLFREDPQVEAILTPEFYKKFLSDYNRMCQERRNSASDADSKADFWERVRVNGHEMPDKMFDALIKDYPQINALPVELKARVRFLLLDYCGLMPGLA